MGDTRLIIFSFSNWLKGFNPRVFPVFIRGLRVTLYDYQPGVPEIVNMLKNLQKKGVRTFFRTILDVYDDIATTLERSFKFTIFSKLPFESVFNHVYC